MKSEVAQLCPILRSPMDCSPSGSSIHGIFQARVLEWGAIAFSDPHTRRLNLERGDRDNCAVLSRSVVSDSFQPHGL